MADFRHERGELVVERRTIRVELFEAVSVSSASACSFRACSASSALTLFSTCG
jgi:hypothetical protein